MRKDVSPVAAIYGANAAGKSAVVKALQFVPTAVRDSFRDWQGDSAIPRTAFALSTKATTVPSRFELEFIADDGFEYQYGFEVTDEEVVEEFLYQFKTHRRTRLFHRRGAEYEFGSSVLGPKAQLAAITRRNSLFLSAAASANALSSMASAHRWITSSLHVFGPEGHEAIRSRLPSLLERDRSHTRRLMAFIKAADLGIEDISVTTKKLPEETEKTLRQAFANSDLNVDELIASQEKSLAFSHAGNSGTAVLPLSEQSSGSQALLSIGIVVIAALETGSTCVFDEIDSSLHPHLVSELVEVFKDPRLNRKQGQLIFTSHDVSLLRGGATRSLDRDEVWFVEKSPEGASSIAALNEYKARADENWERNYLAGKYGATPVLAIREGLRKLLDSEEQLFEWSEQ